MGCNLEVKGSSLYIKNVKNTFWFSQAAQEQSVVVFYDDDEYCRCVHIRSRRYSLDIGKY